ncbi:MAG: hypothetical protein ACNA7O_12080 [Rhodobacterales bacterium]
MATAMKMKLIAMCALTVIGVKPDEGLAQQLYSEMPIERRVNANIECAATIMALGDDQALAVTISGYFMNRAVETMTSRGGWENRESAEMSVISRTMFMIEDIHLGLGFDNSPSVLLNKQEACVVSALHY